MKKTLLYSVIGLALVLGLILPMAVPVMAQTASSLIMTLSVNPTNTTSTGTLYYEVTLVNTSVPGANAANVTVSFDPPGPTGAAGAYGTPVVLDTNRVIAVGETVVYNATGGGGAEARPALAVNLGAIPLNYGVTVVYAQSEFDGLYIYSPPYTAQDSKNIPATVTWPPPPVGGETFPIGKLSILAPWIALGAAIVAGAAIFTRRRRHVRS
jgi:hypothetical protein